MLVLIGIGFLAGLITALSPCVLPVLPVIVAGAAAGGPRRPYAVIVGLVGSFTLSLLFAAWLLDRLGLPLDLLRNIALALLFLVAATLVLPPLAGLLERPFLRFTRRTGRDLGGGVLLGASLGLVLVPCAGPVLAAIAVIAASHDVGLEAFALTLAYSLGMAGPLLLAALGGQRASRLAALRAHAVGIRRVLGVVVGLTALGIALNVDRHFTTAVPGYTKAVQDRIEGSALARRRLTDLSQSQAGPGTQAREELDDFGPAPAFRDISLWLNTPGGRPVTTEELRGKVVLIDFWTYTCINCLRELPHVKAWDAAYRRRGLVVVGVHTPEFAFEHVPANVRRAVRDLGINYPVPLDNAYGTWTAWANRYWPAIYLVDRRGRIRYAHYGEGEYDRTDRAIRTLLADRAGQAGRTLPDLTPDEPLTPETYLGWERLSPRYSGSPILEDQAGRYGFPPTLPADGYAYAGRWRVEAERIVAVESARLRIRFHARLVHLVLTGRGTVGVVLNGRLLRRVGVREDRLYTLLDRGTVGDGLLELRFTPGLAAYAFTFGDSASRSRRSSAGAQLREPVARRDVVVD